MAGPGAQIFVNGFRGGRLPPKDQIQQIRFHTNSFSAEYHEAGMIRVEVITKPGMGGWRGMTNFGFRDESLNAKNDFADEKGAEQMRRYMVNFQGPIAKGKTGLTVSFDGNSSYDSRTIDAQSPTSGAVTGLAETPTDAMNFSARVEHLIGASSQLQAEYSRRQNDRSNLGVGDFDLPERAYATDNSTDTFRLRSTNVIGKKVFSEFRFSLIDSTLSTTSAVDAADHPRQRRVQRPAAPGQMGDRHAREIELAQNFDFTIGRKHSMRAGVLFEAGWWDSNQRSNALRHLHVHQPRRLSTPALPANYSIRIGDPLVDYSQIKAGWFLQDDFRPAKTLQISVGVRQEIQTAGRFASGTSRRARRSPGTPPRRRPCAAATASSTTGTIRRSTSRRFASTAITRSIVIVQNPGFPVIDGGGTRLPASVIRSASLEQPIIQQASIGLERPLAAWADFRTDYMWTRGSNTLRSINVNAPVNGVRPDPTVGNITEIQSSGKRASDRVTVALNARYIPRRILGMVMYQYANSRNFADFADRAAVRQHSIRTRTGVRRRRTCGTASSSTSTRRSANGVRARPQRAGLVGAALQHHHRPRCQRRHGVQRSSRRRRPQQRARRVAVDHEHPARTSRSASAARAPARRTCRCRRRRHLRVAAP